MSERLKRIPSLSWHARLRHYELSRADAKAITNMNCFLQQAGAGEVFAEDSPNEAHSGKLRVPERIMFRRINVNSLVASSVHGQVRLLIALYVKCGDSNPACHGLFKNG